MHKRIKAKIKLMRKMHQVKILYITDTNIYTEFSKTFTGICCKWSDNGQLRWENNYKNGKRHGFWRGWDDNGQLRWEDNYKGGKRHGISRGWHENGQLDYENNYNEGMLISSNL